jgi:hypothetical protein
MVRRVRHTTTSSWDAIFVLPNLNLEAPIDGGAGVLVPGHDPRVRKIIDAHPRFGSFLSRFSDEFGQGVEPAVILRASDASQGFCTTEAIAGFRDVIALSVIPLSWANQLASPHQFRTYYSDAFTFYPWMLDRHFEHLMAQTPAMMGIQDIEEFGGQTLPAVPPAPMGLFEIDEQLLTILLAAWRRRFSSGRPSWRDLALFRSLNMAQQASRMPAGPEATIYDLGRQIGLWVSAFEILAHTGAGGRSDLGKVIDLIDRAPWHIKACRLKLYGILKKGKAVRRGVLGTKLYRMLYDLRNDFLHGNPITRSDLTHRRRLPTVSWAAYAAPLYRVALASFLEAEPNLTLLPPGVAEGSASPISTRLRQEHRTYEKALATAAGGWRS